MVDAVPWNLTLEQYERLKERARAELHELRRSPRPAGSVDFLRQLGYEVSAWRLLGRVDEANRAAQDLLKSWHECVRTEESFLETFALMKSPIIYTEEKWYKMSVLEDGVQLAIASKSEAMLLQFCKYLGKNPNTKEEELTWSNWWRWWPSLRLLLSFATGGYGSVRAEREELWEQWWTSDLVDEEDWDQGDLPDWQMMRAIEEGNAGTLQTLLSTWYAAQRTAMVHLSESRYHDKLYPGIDANQLLELWPATLLRLAERRGLALSLGSYPAPWILQALGAPPASVDK
jgi:hypothetical protein